MLSVVKYPNNSQILKWTIVKKKHPRGILEHYRRGQWMAVTLSQTVNSLTEKQRKSKGLFWHKWHSRKRGRGGWWRCTVKKVVARPAAWPKAWAGINTTVSICTDPLRAMCSPTVPHSFLSQYHHPENHQHRSLIKFFPPLPFLTLFSFLITS